ncbi:phosphatase PAP2 family protein [Falsibacillus pallidus]|uniref:phosphatase PAP2 family protein n=1 Tax=Falsibacillus pallidus TaxID=493781 RepID=UPI003D976549
MEKTKSWFVEKELNWLYSWNNRHPSIIAFFRMITHLGGAFCTIALTILLILIGNGSLRETAVIAALSLTGSHIAAAFIKKMVRRIRPYMQLSQVSMHIPPLKDHSFPSGHSTAIFSVATPFMIVYPITAPILFPAASLVAVSRVALGVHYPSDVACGSALGILFSILFLFLL